MGKILLIILLLSGVAYGQDLPVNPNEFSSWTPVEAGPCPDGIMLCVVAENPDKSSEFTEVLIVVHPQTSAIVAFILKKGKEYFAYKLTDKGYELVLLKETSI